MSRRTYIEETYLYAHDGYTRSKHDTINHSEAILQRFERTDSDERERNAATSARDAEAARTRDVEQQSSGGLNGQARAGADLVSQLVGGGVRARVNRSEAADVGMSRSSRSKEDLGSSEWNSTKRVGYLYDLLGDELPYQSETLEELATLEKRRRGARYKA